MKKTFKKIERNGVKYQLLDLPNTDIFRYSIVNEMGSNAERLPDKKLNYGITHLIEHLSFKETIDYTTDEMVLLRNKYGYSNATTCFDMVTFYYKSITCYYREVINYVNNTYYNNLTRISDKLFELEKDIVKSEFYQFLNFNINVFYSNVNTSLYNLDADDNIYGHPDIIDKITLQDCIDFKDQVFNQDKHINITYDSTAIDIEKVLCFIEKNKKHLRQNNTLPRIDYKKSLVCMDKYSEYKIKSDLKQTNLVWNFKLNSPVYIQILAMQYLSKDSETSFDKYIREDNGLTYHIGTCGSNICGNFYRMIYTDCKPENEGKLKELLLKSIKDSVDNFTPNKFKDAVQKDKIREKLDHLNLNEYIKFHSVCYLHPEIYAGFKELLHTDLDKMIQFISDKYFTFEKLKNALDEVYQVFNKKEFSLCKSLDNNK